MKQEVLSKLEKNKVRNDLGFPVWIYQIENIVVGNKRYLKVYLFNRYFNDENVNRIQFIHNNNEYIVDSFNIVSDYNNKNVVGCIIEINLEDVSSDLAISKEIVNGTVYIPENNLVEFYSSSIGSDKVKYLKNKKLIEIYPTVYEGYWLCSCGRINNKKEKCICGKEIDNLNDIFNYDYDDNMINDFLLEHKLSFDLSKSFDENMDSYFGLFKNSYPLIDVNKIKDKFNFEEEKQKYTEKKISKEKEEKLNAENKKKRNIILAVCSALLAIFVAIYIFVIAPNNKYNEAKKLFDSQNYLESMTMFEELNSYKDSQDYVIKCKLYQAEVYLQDADYTKSIELLSQIKDANENTKEQYNKVNYEYAVSLQRTGNYDDAISIFKSLEDYKDSKDQIMMCRGPLLGDNLYFGDYNWTVIGKDVDGYLLITSNNLGKGSIYENWGTKVYTSLNEKERNAILDNKVKDDFGTYYGLFLLSSSEFLKYKENIPVTKYSWWLRNKAGYKLGDYDVYYAVCGNDNPMGRGDGTTSFKVDGTPGELNENGVTGILETVYYRPAVWVKYN